jgi:quercetin 2,3-dioxygenase
MKNSVLHKANTRGHADHGWLNAYHSFSFANWYNPERVQFGMLRVLNDDTVAAGMGFGTHPHDNMEIITIPLEGDLAHKDSMGNAETIKSGEVQVMSAGTGVQHSEFNPNADKQTKLLQIWVFPKVRNVTPRYQQITLNPEDRINNFQQILSPNPDDAGAWIYQDAWFHLGKFDKDLSLEYTIKKEGNGVYAFVIKGDATINGEKLETRDALGIWNTDKLDIQVTKGAEVLLLEIPMEQ